ncbi:MAG: GTP-binding protein, partial [Clostridiales bacterium]|nr:GTP-binding protein [Clostridiales bacterium]
MTDLYLVGGFLGAGKTTLLGAAATRLRGATVGLISNDQAAGLVDTQLFEAAAGTVREVSGSCFCCNFPGFLAAARSLRDAGCDVVLAEPVGSCTDLSATLAQPLKDRHAAEFRLCGLTALADPCRLAAILDGGTSGLHQSAAYIVKKQLEEADIILINKVDLLDAAARDRLAARTAARFPGAQVLCASARTGEGVDRWLAAAGAMDGAGRRVVPVDYDTYAEGEAALGWLNLTASLTALGAADWNDLARRLTDDLAARFRALSTPIGHVKLLTTSSAGYA